MSSIVRPTGSQQTRRFVVLVAALFAIAAGQFQALGGVGQSPAEFAADSDATLRVAGYAFAIWGLIYAWNLIYAIRQVLPATGESDMIRRFGLPSILAFIGIGSWNVAASFDWEVATIVIITGSLIVLLIPLLANASLIRSLGRAERDRWLVAWPLGLLAGWLTIATPVNILTVATGNGDLPAGVPPVTWALLAVVAVVLIGLAVTWRTRLLAFSLPITWGLVGVFMAEMQRNPLLAYSAALAAAILLVLSIAFVFRIKPGIERAHA